MGMDSLSEFNRRGGTSLAVKLTQASTDIDVFSSCWLKKKDYASEKPRSEENLNPPGSLQAD